MQGFERERKRDPASVMMAAELIAVGIVFALICSESGTRIYAPQSGATMPEASVLLILSAILALGAFFRGISYVRTAEYSLLAPAACVFGGAVLILLPDLFIGYAGAAFLAGYTGMAMLAAGFCLGGGEAAGRAASAVVLAAYPVMYIAGQELRIFGWLCAACVTAAAFGNIAGSSCGVRILYVIRLIAGYAGAAAIALYAVAFSENRTYICAAMLAVLVSLAASLTFRLIHSEASAKSSPDESDSASINTLGLNETAAPRQTEPLPETAAPVVTEAPAAAAPDGEQLFKTLEALGEFPTLCVFLHCPDSRETYRYRAGVGMMKCGEGTEPELLSLIRPDDAAVKARFASLDSAGSCDLSDFIADLWDENRCEFRKRIIRFSRTAFRGVSYIIVASDIGRLMSDILGNENKLRNEISSCENELKASRAESQRIFLAVNEMLISLVEKKSHESQMHIRSVSRFTEILMRSASQCLPELGITADEIKLTANAAILHDIGKIEVPDMILNKAGKLMPDEFELIKLHTVNGADIINRMPFVRGEELTMQYAREIALHHHERADGDGYPDGLHGNDIPLYVQIVSIADVYEALTSPRIYKAALPHSEAMRMILDGECGKFTDQALRCLEYSQEELRKAKLEIDELQG